jgi:hypothetical protein
VQIWSGTEAILWISSCNVTGARENSPLAAEIAVWDALLRDRKHWPAEEFNSVADKVRCRV